MFTHSDISVNYRVWKLLAMNFLLTQELFYPSGNFDGVEDQIVITIVFISYNKR